MQTYIKLYTFVHQGRGADAARWFDRMMATAGRMGGRIRAVYWTEGRYDAVGIEEWPDEDAAMAFTLALAQNDVARSETLHAFAQEDMRRIDQEWSPAMRPLHGYDRVQGYDVDPLPLRGRPR